LLGPSDSCNHVSRRNPVECPKFSKLFDGEVKQCTWDQSRGQCRGYGTFGQTCLSGRAASLPPSPPPPPPPAVASPPPLAGAVSCSSLTLLGPNDNCNHVSRRNPVECPKFSKRFDGELKQCTWDKSRGQCRAYGTFGQTCI
jgi:hypothetical protein